MERMMKEITPYLTFNGNCRDAMTFYQSCIGGELYTMTFAEADAKTPPEAKDRLIHARLKNGDTVLLASDNMPEMGYTQGNDVSLCVACETDAEVDSVFAKLSVGGKTTMAPCDAFWKSRFAMLTDRYGINWMLNHERTAEG
jgi:PhnB protein